MGNLKDIKDNRDIRLQSSGGINKVIILPEKAKHGDLVIHIVDGLNPILKQYNDISKSWVPVGGGIPTGDTLPIQGAYDGDLFMLTDGEKPVLMQYNMNTLEWETIGSDGVNGGVFITDITPVNINDNIGNKLYKDGLNVQLESVTATTNMINVKVLAITGHTHYLPIVEVEGINVNLTALTDKPLFEGWVQIDITGKDEITAIHEDGAEHTVHIFKEMPPVILSANFVGNYQGTQTELKENDTHQINIKVDKDVVALQIDDYGTYKSGSFVVSGTDITVTGIIANRGNTSQLLSARVRVQSPTGAWSNWFDTNDSGNVELVNVLKLNNLYPTITINDIVYPIDQQALKDNEQATVVHTISNYDTVVYVSPNSQLDIANVNIFENNKIVERTNGGYNVSVNNFRISANRMANNATTIVNRVVNITHDFQEITIQKQFDRFQSSIDGEEYWIRVVSNQKLIETPDLSIPHGTWIGNFSTSNDIVWTRYIKVFDSDEKGIHNFYGLKSKNLAGREVNIITGDDTYEFGGFKTRRIYFPAFSPIAPLHVVVTDFSKLNVVDTNGFELTYKNNKTNEVQKFTIVNSNGDTAPIFDHIYNCWLEAVNANATGGYFFDISEGV